MLNSKNIRLAHGHGGLLSQALTENVLLKYFKHTSVQDLEDSAVLPWDADKLVFTTDSFIVQPVFFSGGDIGKLAICGTVNDLAMMGAEPKYISLGLILEEGFAISELEKIVFSIQKTAEMADVNVVTGDTKVVPKGQADGIYMNTSGVGRLIAENISVKNACPGDTVILSGPIGRHGMAIALARDNIGIQSSIVSDVAPLAKMIAEVLQGSTQIHTMRDVTRGGLATILNEIAKQSKTGIRVHEKNLVIPDDVLTASEMLGFDPLYLSNEGCCVIVAPKEESENILSHLRKHPQGKDAAVIGSIVSEHIGHVVLETEIGSRRVLPVLSGEMLPRIC